MSRYIVTGANRGLGFEIARHLAAEPGHSVILAVRDVDHGRRAQARIDGDTEVAELDLASTESVQRFVSAYDEPIAGLVNNAGIQFNDATHWTAEGLEQTFAVNHLNALRLTYGLRDRLRGGRVMFIGSGTHHPKHPTATHFGFRGEQFRSIRNCARGLDTSERPDQLGKDRYATTKFLNMITTVAMARRFEADQLFVLCLDPGLMPGTDLARTAPALLRFGWHYVLPIVARMLPDTSTTARSGRQAARLMTADRGDLKHGGIYAHDGRLSKRVSSRVFDTDLGDRVLEESLAIGAASGPIAHAPTRQDS